MDSVAVAAIQANTAAVQMLHGGLWIAMGFFGFLWGIQIMLKYTLKGH